MSINKLKRILLLADTLYLLAGGFLGPIYALYVKKIVGDLLDASPTLMFACSLFSFTISLLLLQQKRKVVHAGV